MAVVSNWADLPRDLLDKIAKCLTLYADYIRLRAVCFSWQSALPKTPNQLPRQFPLLMLPSMSGGERSYEFFSIAENKSYFLDFPPMELLEKLETRYPLGSSCHGWLVFDDPRSLLLFNPFTNAQIELPPVKAFRYSTSRFPNKKLPGLPPEYVINEPPACLSKVVLSASPSSSDFMAVALISPPCNLLICRCGDEGWTLIEKRPEASTKNSFIEDVIFHKQQIVTLSDLGEVVIREVVDDDDDGHNRNNNSSINVSIKQILKPPSNCSIFGFLLFLIEWKDDLFVFSWKDTGSIGKRSYAAVHKLDWNKNSTAGIIDDAKWSQVESLGDLMYFPYLSPPSFFSAHDFPGSECRGNCLYLPFNIEPSIGELALFDMADKQAKPWPAYPQGYIGRPWNYEWITPSPT